MEILQVCRISLAMLFKIGDTFHTDFPNGDIRCPFPDLKMSSAYNRALKTMIKTHKKEQTAVCTGL